MRTSLLYAAALALVIVAAGCGGGGGGGLPGTNANPGDTSGGGGTGGGGTGGDGTGGGGTVADTLAPSLVNARLSTAALDFRGGQVAITADVTDASGVQAVVATVQKVGGGATTDVPMTLQFGTTYQGNYAIPANQNTTPGLTDSYAVTIRATDVRGNATAAANAGTVTVAAPQADDPLPPPPSFPSGGGVPPPP